MGHILCMYVEDTYIHIIYVMGHLLCMYVKDTYISFYISSIYGTYTVHVCLMKHMFHSHIINILHVDDAYMSWVEAKT